MASAGDNVPTEQELNWARAIKHAALAERLTQLSDFEYLHHALVAKNKVKKAIKRMRGLEKFRSHYKLEGSIVDDPNSFFRATESMFPGLLGSVGKDSNGRMVQLCVYKNFDPRKLKGETEWRDMMAAFYYMFQAMHADISSIRNGIVFAADCKGMGWKNFSFEVEKRAAEFYQDSYPVRMKHIYMLDAPRMINVMIDLVKVFLSKKIRDVIQNIPAEKYFKGGNVPISIIPESFGGDAKPEWTYSFLERQLEVRRKNEAEFKL